MISIDDKHKCCGCNACVQRCPRSCISTNADEQGFYYPSVDLNRCTNCGLCETVCPVINKKESRLPKKQYCAVHQNEGIRSTSSSGGIFYAIAAEIINQGGYVAGVTFDERWMAKHIIVDNLSELLKFKGAKYIQSDIGNVYLETEKLLKTGKKVLFSGTPCQIAGLKMFLRKQYDNLLCIDIVCHGVPSPMVWKDYLTELTNETCYWQYIDHINFKDKRKSWSRYALHIEFRDNAARNIVLNQSTKENIYTVPFLRNYTIRPSCFQCPSKEGRSLSDITLGDFWGIDSFYPELNDEKGYSIVLCYTTKGYEILKKLNISLKEVSYHEATVYNPATTRSPKQSPMIDKFWNDYISSNDKIKILEEYSRPAQVSKFHIITNRLKLALKQILHKF